MAKRSVCICEGEYIGIESIFTVINGKQINIPQKVEELRGKSRRNLLTCSCGCGAILTLVAGEKNLREQHYRLKYSKLNKECKFVTECKCSVDSKIVLKCWLDDKLQDPNIESRVPIAAIDDTNRKYEFTLFSRERSVAISYSYDRVNLSDEKFNILESNSGGIKIIYIIDIHNGGVKGQYPESLMKIQLRQGYCLYLSIDGIDYCKAKLEAVFYERDIDGLWQEVTFASGLISQFNINDDGKILFEGQLIERLLEYYKKQFYNERDELLLKRKQEEQERAEIIRKQQEEEDKQQQEINREIQYQQELKEKQQIELEEKHRTEEERNERLRREREDEFKKVTENDYDNGGNVIIDGDGNRWVKCKFCNKKGKTSEFSSYGGIGEINKGICYECSRDNPAYCEALRKKERNNKSNKKIEYDLDKCPECGGLLKIRSGCRGPFVGCSSYPKCNYTRDIPKNKR